jgi:hypothetical protein
MPYSSFGSYTYFVVETKHIGWINCDKCRIQYITKPTQVTIWFSADEADQLAEVTCPSCKTLVESRIGVEAFMSFKRYGVEVKNFNDKFEPLSDEQISEWDISKELAAFYAKA